MLLTYFKTAFRNLRRFPFFSLINILALAISISFCLIILTIIKGQFEFDSFHKDKSSIYRVTSTVLDKNNNAFKFATTPFPLSEQLKLNNSSIEEVSSVRQLEYIKTTFNLKSLDLNAVFVSSGFFKIFDFPLVPSNAFSSLDKPNSVLISTETAEKLFDNKNPVGKVIKLENLGIFQVAGVVNMQGLKSHLSYDMYLSSPSLKYLEANRKIDSLQDDWHNYQSTFTYFKLKGNTRQAQAINTLNDLSKSASKYFSTKNNEKSIQFQIQPLTEITPSRGYLLDNSKGITYKGVFGIAAAVFCLLCLTCFNYSNLTVARALTRAKEIGVRKVMGASRRQVFAQFLVESITVTFIAMLLACVIIPFIPLNDSIANLFHQTKLNGYIVILFILFSILAGILAGLIPGILLSRFKTIEVLKNLSNLKVFKFSSLNRVLTITQFATCTVIIIALSTMYRQSQFMKTADYGFAFQDIINLPLPSEFDYPTMAAELGSIAGVRNISGISSNLGYHPVGYYKLSGPGGSEIDAGYYFVDVNLIENFDLKLVAGENFWRDAPLSQQDRIIINEKAVEFLGLGSPAQAIGKVVRVNDSLQFNVIGVLRDFHNENFKNLIGPVVFRYDIGNLGYLNLKIDHNRFAGVSAAIKNKYKNLNLEPPSDIEKMDTRLTGEQAHTKDVMFFSYISLMFLAISCLAVLGMAAYAAETKTREVSIRKMLGAGIIQVIFLLGREFFSLIVISLIIGIPIGILASKGFLNGFAYKVAIGFLPTLLAVLIVFVLGLAAFGSQIINTVLVPPIRRLNSN